MSEPEKIGRFKVLKKLGQGGMGVVYLVEDPQTRRELALKLLLGEASPQAVERFSREAEVLARLQHPGVVRVHSVGQVPQGMYLLEERVEGEPLDRLLERGGPLDPSRAAKLVRDVAGAIEAVHAAGILYRDLKPANVMLQANDAPMLLDFGLARDENAERLTKTGDVLGTPAFMAPEQANGRSTTALTPATDVYGLGALLYALLVGQPPFSGSMISVLAGVLHREPEWPSAARRDVPRELDAVCRLAMAKRAADRYPSAAALREDLDRFLRGERTHAAARLGVSRRRLLVPLGLAGALVVVGFGVALTRSPSAPRKDPPKSVAAPTTASATAPPPLPVMSAEERRWRELPLPAGVTLGARPPEYVAKDGSVLLWIPGGEFVMGSEVALKSEGQDAPAHRVRLTGYFIGETEVTWSQFRRFCQETGHALPVVPAAAVDVSEHPVRGVSWHDAVAYCAWAGLRLPSEAQWEFAARGERSLPYPWGTARPDPTLCHFDQRFTAPVGSYPAGASPFGCLDMSGNVWEWVDDRFSFNFGLFDLSVVEVDPTGPSEAETRVQRGGSYDRDADGMHAAWRISVPPARADSNTGFRVAASRP